MRQKCKDCIYFEKYNGMPYCKWIKIHNYGFAPMPLDPNKINQYNNCKFHYKPEEIIKDERKTNN